MLALWLILLPKLDSGGWMTHLMATKPNAPYVSFSSIFLASLGLSHSGTSGSNGIEP